MITPWLIMPTASKVHVPATVKAWHEKGYKIALWQDIGASHYGVDFEMRGKYPGVWNAINALAWGLYPLGAEVFVFAGDDMSPDPKFTAQEIAKQYLDKYPDGLGVMQPCGDPQGEAINGLHNAARICGSPWFGREWVRRSYGGHGPTDGRYWHFYGDESLARVAEKLGVMWWRFDLTQYHYHWSFGHMKRQDYHEKNQKHWDADGAIFKADEKDGFAYGRLIQ